MPKLEASREFEGSLALTLPQLLSQASALGFSDRDLVRLRSRYQLAERMSDGLYRAQGQPLISHLVRSSSIVLAVGQPLTTAIATMFHARYVLDRFEGSWRRRAGPADRRFLQREIGQESEALVWSYEQLPWHRRDLLETHLQRLESYGPVERSTIVMRLANELEDHLDLSVLYWKGYDYGARIADYGGLEIELAEKLELPALSRALRDTFDRTLAARLPIDLASDHAGGYGLPRRRFAERSGAEELGRRARGAAKGLLSRLGLRRPGRVATRAPEKRTRVLHAGLGRWLPITQRWLYLSIARVSPYVENHIVCTELDNLEHFWLPRIHALEDRPRWRLLASRWLRKLRLRRYRSGLLARGRAIEPDILHSHFGNIGWENSRVARRLGAKHVVTFYGMDVGMYPSRKPRWARRYHELFVDVDRVLCEGPEMARAVAALGCPEAKLRVHHLGVELDALPFRPRVWDGRSPLRVLVAAAFREKKGIPDAMAALALVSSDIPLEVTVIGGRSPGRAGAREQDRILACIEEGGLRDRVRMPGWVPFEELMREAYAHHVFLSPSLTASNGDSEGGAPVALIEMAATGMIVVSTRHCDIPGVIEHGRTGFLAEERDIEGLGRCLRELAARREQWPEIARAARTHIEAEFDSERQGRRLAEIYSEVMDA